MSESEEKNTAEEKNEALAPASGETAEDPVVKKTPRRSRFTRHTLWVAVGGTALAAILLASFCLWLNSPSCENLMRERLAVSLGNATGARVEMRSFHWRPFALQMEVDGLVLHGQEAFSEDPLLRVGSLSVQLSLLNLFSPKLLLHRLEINDPQAHLIVYENGSTNLPYPQKPKKHGKSILETLFDLKAGRITIARGALWLDARATSFDFQNRYAQMNLNAEDFAFQLSYVEPHNRLPETFHIEAGARNLAMTRGPAPRPGLGHGSLPVEGRVQLSLDLEHSAAYLRSLQITAHARRVPDRVLRINGSIEDFTHPRWQFHTEGELDLRLVDSLTGFPRTPEGLAHLNLQTWGHGAAFYSDGSLRVENGAYIGDGIYARGFQLQTQVHASPQRLLIDHIALHLHQGGEIDGTVDLGNWLKILPVPRGVNPEKFIENPVDGQVNAKFTGVPLNAIMEMFCDPPFQNLGIDTRLNGPAEAVWQSGDEKTLAVNGLFHLTPSQNSVPGMVPAQGLIDATYHHRDGSVDLRDLTLQMPQSRLTARGHLGAYPLHSPSAISVDLQTANLGEFDTVLRDLGVSRVGRSGAAALPVALKGQGEFHGSWSGSLIDPRLSGHVQATQLAVEMGTETPAKTAISTPAPAPDKNLLHRLLSVVKKPEPVKTTPPPTPKMVKFDSVEATGSYSPTLIHIDHAVLKQQQATLQVDGTLTPAPGKAAVWNGNSILHASLRASQLATGQLQPIMEREIPISGQLDAQISADGPLRSLSGSGWMELNKAVLFNEPLSRIRAQGSFSGQSIHLTSLSLAGVAGQLSASGTVDLAKKNFQVQASTPAIDIAQIDTLRKRGFAATGKLALTVSGSGSFDDPRLKGNATLSNLTMGGDSMGTVQLSAYTGERMLHYDLTSRLNAPELTAHGLIALQGDHQSQTQINFSHFNIGALLPVSRLKGLNVSSELAGTIHVEGPLRHPDQMRGGARLQELVATISGVHLHSDGEVRAQLANGHLHLDPLHITGENTDMRLQGSLSLLDREKRQLDIATSGTINLALARTIDPDLTASGTSTFTMEAHGPLLNPDLRGRVDFRNGSLVMEDMPNGLSQIYGSLEFNQNRLEVKSLTALTGGGQISLGGYMSYQNGLYANLTVSGKGVRIRYPHGISSLADASLHLQGTQNNMILSGNVLITRFTVNPDFDFAALSSQTSGVQSLTPSNAPSNHIRLDVHLTSSPQLNFQNAYAKLAGDVDLHLRGTLASPSLLGRVTITDGSALLAGTRYELQRGELIFTNPVRIQPSIDLNATAHVEDFDIALGIHGPIDHPAISYRSDPPLPEADVVALLALGRTQNQQRLYTAQQQSQSSSTDALLGGALNATVSSRVQKLFGAGSVKVDPNYLGAMGNSTSRIIVEEQLGRYVTLTWATNINTTGQQLLQADIAVNRHVSLQVARDESGVFSMVLKMTRRYK